MKKTRLKSLLDAETAVWSQKTFTELVEELADVAASQRGQGADFHQFEAEAIEVTPDYIHVLLSVDDGSLWRAYSPLTRGFIVHRDGRVEI